MEFQEIVALLVLMLEEEYASVSRLELIQKMAESYLKQFDWKDEKKAQDFLQTLQQYKLKKAPQLEGVPIEGRPSPLVEAEGEDFELPLNFSELDSLINSAVATKSGLNPEVIGYVSKLIEECKKYMFDEEVPEVMITSECTALLWKGMYSALSLVVTEDIVDISISYLDSEEQETYSYPLDIEYSEVIIEQIQEVTCGGSQ